MRGILERSYEEVEDRIKLQIENLQKRGILDYSINPRSKFHLDQAKIVWHGERVEKQVELDNRWSRGIIPPYCPDELRYSPVSIDWALIPKETGCNQKCVYCYGNLQANKADYITRDEAFHFLDDAAEIGVKATSLVSDGESTLKPYIYDVISYGRSNGIDMALGTNGVLLKEEYLENMLKDLTYLRFNISAGESDAYNKIHNGGNPQKLGDFDKVINNIEKCVSIKRKNNLETTIGMQMVLMPQYADQVIPLALLGRKLNPDYLVIKHCSDDEKGSLNIDYEWYKKEIVQTLLKTAEAISTNDYSVQAKWSKITQGNERPYERCYGPPLQLQFSGSGLIAPCGMFFGKEYEKFHIGNLKEKSFKDIWKSERYWEVMHHLASESFNAKKECGCLCLQHKLNEYLEGLKKGCIKIENSRGNPPMHVNFI